MYSLIFPNSYTDDDRAQSLCDEIPRLKLEQCQEVFSKVEEGEEPVHILVGYNTNEDTANLFFADPTDPTQGGPPELQGFHDHKYWHAKRIFICEVTKERVNFFRYEVKQ